MDIRLGVPVAVGDHWRWWERPVLKRAARHVRTIQDVFAVSAERGAPSSRALALCMRRETARIRDQ